MCNQILGFRSQRAVIALIISHATCQANGKRRRHMRFHCATMTFHLSKHACTEITRRRGCSRWWSGCFARANDNNRWHESSHRAFGFRIFYFISGRLGNDLHQAAEEVVDGRRLVSVRWKRHACFCTKWHTVGMMSCGNHIKLESSKSSQDHISQSLCCSFSLGKDAAVVFINSNAVAVQLRKYSVKRQTTNIRFVLVADFAQK